MLTSFASRPSNLLSALAWSFAIAASGCGASVGPIDAVTADAADADAAVDAADAASYDTGSSCVSVSFWRPCEIVLEWSYGCELPDVSDFRSQAPLSDDSCTRLCPPVPGTGPLTCRTSTGHGTWWLRCSRCP
jgi:hypothetical protein